MVSGSLRFPPIAEVVSKDWIGDRDGEKELRGPPGEGFFSCVGVRRIDLSGADPVDPADPVAACVCGLCLEGVFPADGNVGGLPAPPPCCLSTLCISSGSLDDCATKMNKTLSTNDNTVRTVCELLLTSCVSLCRSEKSLFKEVGVMRSVLV